MYLINFVWQPRSRLVHVSYKLFVSCRFVVKIPDGMAAEQAAGLLCAGVTVYSPLNHFGLKGSGLRGGILGLGGVGHMGVKLAKALGHHVTVISSSDKKRQEAIDHLGADDYLVSSDLGRMQQAADSLDYIIDTVPALHPLEPYLSLLKLDGKLILLGVVNNPLQFVSPMVILGELLYLYLVSKSIDNKRSGSKLNPSHKNPKQVPQNSSSLIISHF